MKLTGNGGPAAVGSIGYGLGNGFRIEVAGDWRAQHDRLDPGKGSRDGGANLPTAQGVREPQNRRVEIILK